MKRTASILLILCSLLTVAACAGAGIPAVTGTDPAAGGTDPSVPDGTKKDGTTESSEQQTAADEDSMKETKKVPLETGKQYAAVPQKLFTFDAPDARHHIMQGNVFDGETYTAAFYERDGSDAGVVLVQLDKDGKLLRVSDAMNLYHANNITYNPRIGQFVVTHCQGDGHYAHYSLVDPVTLTETATGELERPFFALAYSPERDMYGSGEWAGETVDVWDGDMKLLRSFSVERPSTLSQGCFCDGDYIWFVRSSVAGSGCELRLYDWETGSLAFRIPIEGLGGVEPEALSVVDGEVYVLCNNRQYNGGIAFRLDFEERN